MAVPFFGMIKRISKVASPTIFPQSQVIEVKKILGRDIIIKDVKFLKGQWREFCVILFQFKGRKTLYSTACSGQVVVKKLKEVKKKKALPILGAIIMKKGRKNNYYDIK